MQSPLDEGLLNKLYGVSIIKIEIMKKLKYMELLSLENLQDVKKGVER